jgi:solute carrier family 25 citrate transporter 1
MEVVKIRLQAQMHSLADPLETPQYRNAGHAVYTIVREEGFAVLYRGVTLTALRQATNQGVPRCLYMRDIGLQQHRGKLHRVSGIKEILSQKTAGAV